MRTKFNLKFISLLVFFCLLFSIQTSSVSAAIPENVDILFIGKTYDRWQDNPVRAALSLDSTFNVNETSIIAETESDIAGISSGTSTVAIIQDYIISNSSINSLKTWVEAGNSLIIFMGTRLTQNTSIFQELGIFSHSEVTEISPGIDSATFEENKTSPITSSIYWNSVPSCKNYTVFPITSNISNNIMMQKLPQQSTSLKHVKDPLIFNYSLGTGNVVIFSMWIEEEQSIDFVKSSYFNYLIYSATITKGGLSSEKLAFHEWSQSPIPQGLEIVLILGLLTIALLVVFYMIRVAKKRSKTPIDFTIIEKEIPEEKEEKEGKEKKEKKDGWENIGFHRQISGYFTGLFMGIFGGLPLMVLGLFVYPTFINPFPNTQGNYILVKDIFLAIWTVVDFGTSYSMITYFNKHRIERPEKAVHYIQIYIYWQLISGFMQLAAVSIVSIFVINETPNYGYMSFFFLLHAMIQFPGFLRVMSLALFAVQRADLHQIGGILAVSVFSPVCQYLSIIIFRLIFMNNIRYGETFGIIVGLTFGDWMALIMYYFLSRWMLKKVGYTGKTLFRWDFTKEEIKEVFKYGRDLVVGQVWFPLVTTFQVFMITAFIPDYATQYGLFNLAGSIGAIGALGSILVTNMQSPIAEAYAYQEEHGKRLYLERLFLSTFHLLNLINTAIVSSLLVSGTKLIYLMAPDQWTDAALYLNVILIGCWAAGYSQMIDPLFAGTSKTKLLMVFWVIESGSRFIMLIFLIQGLRLGVIAVAYAQLAGLLSKGILGVYFCRKEITQPKMHFWQVWIAPFVAGFLNFIVLFILDIFLDDMLIILFGFIFPFSVYVIISAWLGSWDENQIKEYTRAKDISKKGLKPILSMFLGSAKIGMKIPSPFSGKFKIDIWEDAQREIEELEAMRKELIM